MNKKKIYKLLSSTVTGFYLVNVASVFAQESIETNIKIDDTIVLENNDSLMNDKEDKDINQNEKNEDIVIKEETTTKEDVFTKDDVIKDIILDNNNNNNKDNKDNAENKEENKNELDINDDEQLEVKNIVSADNNLKRVNPRIIVSSPTTNKPTIDYIDSKVILKDNGAIVSGNKTIESFDNPQDLEFSFSNSDWVIEDGVMKSKPISSFSKTQNSFSLNLEKEGTLTIKARASCTDFGANCIIKINGEEIFSQNGENLKFTTTTYHLNAGVNTIEFEHSREYGINLYNDALIIDEIIVNTTTVNLNSEKIEYRIDGGTWVEYKEPFLCENQKLIEARSFYDSNYSDISSVYLDTVEVLDENLKKEFNYMFNKDDGNSLFLKSEIESIVSLDISNKEIKDITGIEAAINLTSLNISNNEIEDISDLNKLTKIESIVAKNNKIQNIDSLSTLVGLTSIDFEGNNIQDIAAISKLSKLDTINFKNNNITNKSAITVISNMNSLNKVTISFNIPSLDLLIGKDGDLNNIPNLYLDNSVLNSLTVANADNLKNISAQSSIIKTVDISNCKSTSVISLGLGKINNISISKINSKTVISLYKGEINDVKIFDNIGVNNINCFYSVIGNLSINNLEVNDNIVFDFDFMKAKNISVTNIKDNGNSNINASDIIADFMTIANARFSGANLVRSFVGQLDVSNNVTMKNISFYSFESSSRVDLTNTDIIYLYSNNMKVKDFVLRYSHSLVYLSLDGLTSDSVLVENCSNLDSIALTKAKVKTVEVKNLNKLTNLDAKGLTSDNLIVENCPVVKNLQNTYGSYKGNIKSFKISNLDAITKIDFSEYSIEDVSINNCKLLSDIDLSKNKIKDISKIRNLNALVKIDLSNNAITNISYLRNIPSLQIDNILALSQNIELTDVYTVAGPVFIQSPNIIDYNNNKVDIKQITDNSSVAYKENGINIGTYTKEGVYNKILEFEAINSNYSLLATQKLIIDSTSPTLIINPDKDYWTNSGIKLNVEAKDVLSGLKYIVLPDNTTASVSNINFNVDTNGEYEFEAVDLVGNSVKKSITISNIDKDKPIAQSDIKFNEDKLSATILIKANDLLSGVKNITLPNGDVVDSDSVTLDVSKNDTYIFKIKDVAGNIHTETVVINELKNNVNNDKNDNLLDIPDTSGNLILVTFLSVVSMIGGVIMIKKNKYKDENNK